MSARSRSEPWFRMPLEQLDLVRRYSTPVQVAALKLEATQVRVAFEQAWPLDPYELSNLRSELRYIWGESEGLHFWGTRRTFLLGPVE